MEMAKSSSCLPCERRPFDTSCLDFNNNFVLSPIILGNNVVDRVPTRVHISNDQELSSKSKAYSIKAPILIAYFKEKKEYLVTN